jgi:DNA polymerase III subunit epsilon
MSLVNSFTAIDIETAHYSRNSICQIGLARVEKGVFTKKLNLLVQPPGNIYNDRFCGIHGITPAMTKKELTFDKQWHHIEPFIKGQNVVAHNGHSFDFNCLQQSLAHYDISIPVYHKHCTYKIYRGKLPDLCMLHGIKLEHHHDALADAIACAQLFLLYLKSKKIKNIATLNYQT